MSDFDLVEGFEEAWRPPARPRRRSPETLRGAGVSARGRLARLVARTPEVMVKVTGRTRDPGHLLAHLDYISRKGGLEAEDRQGALLDNRADIRDLADDWSASALFDSRRRARTPFSVSLVLSMPAQTDAIALRDAARGFARTAFADRFDYVLALHTDTRHPHVHLAVRALGDDGVRLNPKKADLAAWREMFAQALRDRGVAAEATPRRARGVTRKAERTPLRKIRERHEAGQGPVAEVRRAAYHEAARAAFHGEGPAGPWEAQLGRRQALVRALYLAQARRLSGSDDPEDRRLGAAVEAFVRDMPAPDSQRLDLARELRARNARQASPAPPPEPGRERPDRGR